MSTKNRKDEISAINLAKHDLERELGELERLLAASAAPQLVIGSDANKVYALPDTVIGRIIHKAIHEAAQEKRHQIKHLSENLLSWL